MWQDITLYGGIFLAGFLSFLSPCVLPIVPPYLCYLGGVGFDQISGEEEKIAPEIYRRVIISAVFFVLGFTTVFVSLGASASLLGGLVNEYRDGLSKIAGGIIILFGLHFLGLFKIGFLHREARFSSDVQKASTMLGAYVLGLAFAFGWTPCVGPILAPILTLAAGSTNVNSAMVMLLVYALGLGIPFILAAFAIKPFLAFRTKFSRHLGLVEKLMGGVLVLAGILFLTGGITDFSNWILTNFEGLGQIEKSLVPEGLDTRIIQKAP